MKKLTLILLCGVASMALSADEYTIQTISALKESSITPAFEKKVRKSALPVTKKKEGECNIVMVGGYPSAKKAHTDLSKAKKIAQDAFIRPINRNIPKACDGKEGAKAAEAKKEAIVAKKEAVTPSPSVAIAEIAATEKSVNNVEPCKAQPCKNVSSAVYIYDRDIGRKSDISEAIEFYKNSPYYSFRPVALQR